MALDQVKFQKCLARWLEFSETSADESLALLKAHVMAVYAALELPPPQIVFCRGPLEQLIFPPLVHELLRFGQEHTEKLRFERVDSEPQVVFEEWRELWRYAFSSIDWQKTTVEAQAEGIGPLLNHQISKQVNRRLNTLLTAQIDELIGIDENMSIQSRFASALEDRFQSFRQVIRFHQPDVTNLWISLALRLPKEMQAHFHPNCKTQFQGLPFTHERPLFDNWMGRWDWPWLVGAEFAHAALGAELHKSLAADLKRWIELTWHSAALLFCRNCCFIYLKPAELYLDESGRLHNPSKKAVEFSDGTALYFWHGFEVPEHIITSPKKIRIKDIANEHNIELRRVMIERYGLDHYIRGTGAKIQHQDECGTLYRATSAGDEDIVVVKVVNATAEPDGSNRIYFLRVPPDMKRAREAVAWTFGMTEQEYKPKSET